jgi:tetratricopeptide (TPR) repeat protein
MTDKEKLDQAMQLVARQDYGASEQIFSQLLLAGSQQAESFYGLGVIRLNQRQLEVAQRQFESCLQLNPRHANALYYLGAIAENHGQTSQALARYQQCLQVNPQHGGALQKLRSTPQPPPPVQPPAPLDHGRPPEPARDGRPPRDRGGDPRGDFYALLRSCDDRVECEMAELLDQIAALIGRRKQRAIARFSFFTLFLILLSVMTLLASTRAPAGLIIFAVVTLIWLLRLFLNLVRAKSSQIWCERDFLLISRGILTRETKTHHLYLLSHRSAEKSQTLMNRLTRDGSLIFRNSHQASDKLPTPDLTLLGFFRSTEIDTLMSHFRALSMLTPTNREVLAAIGELKQIRSGMN